MSDRELNLAIHQEVEGWHWDQWFKDYRRCRVTDDCSYEEVHPMRHGVVPDYCNDPAWCVRMMEKHKIGTSYWRDPISKVWEWWAECGEEDSKDYMEICDSSLTRAVALAVLRLCREGK